MPPLSPITTWLPIDPKSHFSIHNLPFGIISITPTATSSSSSSPSPSSPHKPSPRPAVAIGSFALDLHAFTNDNGFAKLSLIQPHQSVFSAPTLNAFAALGRPMHKVVREYLQSLFLENGPFPDVLQHNETLRRDALIPLDQVTTHLPMQITDYTDFYAGLHHAYNVGVLFRGPQNALQPNYKHLPIGYHGRASSVVVSGTPIRRPHGQILPHPGAEKKEPVLRPSQKLDMELELACFVCNPNALGQPIHVRDAPEYLFGVVLMNDWSARDIQAWEYVPLGPFNSKNFGTTISPWVVLMDALEPFTTTGLPNDTPLLPYLDERGRPSHYAIELKAYLIPSSSSPPSSGEPRTTLTTTSATQLLFSFPQMLVHHTIGGCPFTTGDLMGSGTISGPERGQKGSLLELSENGNHEISLQDGSTRKFLEDGDTIVLTGVCGDAEGALVGFGECVGQIVPALAMKW